MTAGAVGALPLTGVIVRSAANITAGAQSRLSTMLHGVWLLGLTLIFPQLLGLVPLSVLAGILLFFGFRLLNPQGAAALVKENRAEAAIFFLTIAAIIATDLLTGILIGFVLSLLHLFFGVTKASVSTVEHDDLVKLRLGGVVTFLAGPKLTEVLERIDQKRPLEFDTEGLIYIDQATLARLRDWVASYVARGGEASVSWHTLERRQNLLVRE